MKNVEQQITSLLDRQFPNFIREDAPLFVAFLKGYYQWMEQNQETLGLSRKLMSLRDIDTTVDDFLSYFRNKYLEGLPGVDIEDERFLIKHIGDLYSTKGTERAIKLLFRALYNEQATVYLPGQDVFKPSHGTWIRQQYIEIAPNKKNQGFVGKQIVGLVTGSTAFVEAIVRRRIAGRYLDVAYLSSISGNFLRGEQVDLTSSNATFTSPKITGSLSSIEIIDGGQDFAVGDVFSVSSAFGKQGKAQVVEVTAETGVVNFTVNNGGWGYTLQANAIISERVLELTSVLNANTLRDPDLDFDQLEKINQPKYRVYYDTATLSNAYAAGANLFTYHANNTIKAQGRVLEQSVSNSTAGYVVIYSNTGGFVNSDVLYTQSNAQSASIANSTNISANGTVIGSRLANNGNLLVGLSDTQGTFTVSSFGKIQGINSNTVGTVVSVATGESADFLVAEITNEETILFNSDFLAGNNISDVPYMNVAINAASYDFPKTPANLSSIILDALTFTTKTIGSIATIGGINRGQDYTADPFVLVTEPSIIPFGKKDFFISVANPTATFLQGEIVEQTRTSPVTVLTVSSVTGANSYEVGEAVYQANSTVSPQAANGVIAQLVLTGATVTGIVVANVQGTFINNASYPVLSQTTGKSATVTATSLSTIDASSKGLINNVVSSNTTAAVLNVRRLSLMVDFLPNETVLGRTSGATGNVGNIVVQAPSSVTGFFNTTTGYNAIVNAKVQTANNAVANLLVIDSGFGYLNNENLTLTKSGAAYNVLGVANVFQQGEREGFYSSTRGFLSGDKFIHDNDFYQEYSYQIKSGIAFSKYKDIIKRVLHVAGTKMFGAVNMTLEIDALKQENGESDQLYELLVSRTTSTPANAAILTANTIVYQSNGSANVFFGVVTQPLTTTLTLDNGYRTLVQNNVVGYGDSISTPTATGNVVFFAYNLAAPLTSTVILHNVTNPFPTASGSQFGYVNQDNQHRYEYALETLNMVVIKHTSGTFDRTLPLSFESTSVNVDKVTVKLEHK